MRRSTATFWAYRRYFNALKLVANRDDSRWVCQRPLPPL